MATKGSSTQRDSPSPRVGPLPIMFKSSEKWTQQLNYEQTIESKYKEKNIFPRLISLNMMEKLVQHSLHLKNTGNNSHRGIMWLVARQNPVLIK